MISCRGALTDSSHKGFTCSFCDRPIKNVSEGRCGILCDRETGKPLRGEAEVYYFHSETCHTAFLVRAALCDSAVRVWELSHLDDLFEFLRGSRPDEQAGAPVPAHDEAGPLAP